MLAIGGLSCSTDPVGIPTADDQENLNLAPMSPPKGMDWLSGLCECNREDKKMFYVRIIDTGCDNHEQYWRETTIQQNLEDCINEINMTADERIEELCTKIDSICALGMYYAQLEQDAIDYYYEMVRYLMMIINGGNARIINMLISIEKERLTKTVDKLESMLENLSYRLAAIQDLVDDAYIKQETDADDCVEKAKEECAELGVDCLEFDVGYIPYQN
jgi:hypothetical protein